MTTDISIYAMPLNYLEGSTATQASSSAPLVQVPVGSSYQTKKLSNLNCGVSLAHPVVIQMLSESLRVPIVTLSRPETAEVLLLRRLDSYAIYYRIHGDGHLSWATQPNRLVVPTLETINLRYMATSIFESVNPWEDSWLEDVKVLPAGSYLHYRAGRVVIRRYEDYKIPNVTTLSFSDAADAFKKEIVRGTARATVGYQAPAIQLSGGLDSGAVAMAAKELGTEITGYFAGASAPGIEIDSKSAHEIADYLGIRLNLVDSSDYLDTPHLVDFARYTSWLMTGGFRAQDMLMAKAIEADIGPTVLLTGIGGDELMTPDLWNPIAKHGLQALSPARGGDRFSSQAAPPDLNIQGSKQRLVQYVLRPETPFPFSGMELSTVFAPQDVTESPWLTKSAAEGRAEAFEVWKKMLDDEVAEAVSSMGNEPKFYQVLTYISSKLFLNDARLQAGQAGAFRERNIHIASPLLDPAVVELAMTFPSSYRYVLHRGHRISKAILRKAMSGKLPSTVLARTSKIDYNAILQRWVLANMEKVSTLAEPSAPLVTLGLVDPHHFCRMIDTGGWFLRRESRKIVNALIVNNWLEGNLKEFDKDGHKI